MAICRFRFILIDSYSESSGRPVGQGRSTPLENGNFRFILIDSYSESSGRPVADQVADLPPPRKMAISDSY